jgi:lactonase
LKIPGTSISNCWLEGPAFDNYGNLFFTDKLQHRLYRATTTDRTLSVFYVDQKYTPNSIKIHRDGRLFVCCLFEHKVLALTPDGSFNKVIDLTSDRGPLFPNDMVFDAEGNFFFSAFNKYLPTGGVYRVPAGGTAVDLKFADAIASRLKDPNGISLSPAGRYLWVGEGDTRIELRFELTPDGQSALSDLQYRMPGNIPGMPDSNQVDSAGNVYQAMSGGGCVAVLNGDNTLIAQVVLASDQERAQYLGTSNVAFQPGSNQGFITASGYGGGVILTFTGLDKGLPLYSYR